jgi:hypothetical protein
MRREQAGSTRQRIDDRRAERLHDAAIETARLIRQAPGTSFRERPWAYVGSGIIVVFFVGVIGLLVFANALRPPPSKRAFVPDWRCDHYGVGAEVCERVQHTSAPTR